MDLNKTIEWLMKKKEVTNFELLSYVMSWITIFIIGLFIGKIFL